MNTLTILDPRADVPADARGKGPAVGRLRGKRVGLRRDEFWGCWNVVTEEWAKLLEADGARPRIWRAPVVKGEEASVEASADFEAYLDSIDVAITGLANCGSCTLWSVHDGLEALDRGLPTGFVATEHFSRLVRVLTSQAGRQEIRLEILPYPLEGRPEPEVRNIARAAYPALLRELGATI